ncbi:MAG: Na+/H+ antiporter subunit E [Candidatus Muirbacterium halophilum]|nr:Na+/H+ antiporter subunit E [Candidatus Muirbacterium halophilum]MCK9476115.1 Na+/H+ antiporter subunit E [Candidatus Muirbacterium halophilum]
MKNKFLYFKLVRISVITILCFLFWFVISEEFSVLSMVAGLILSFICALYSYEIFIRDDEFHKSAIFFRIDLLFIYFLWLWFESYFATFQLAKMVFSKKLNPGVVRIKTKIRSEIGRTFLANSISLLPGTIALWMEGPYIYVHWYTRKTNNSIYAGKLIKSRLEKIILRIFQ